MKRFCLLFVCMLNILWASAQFSGSGSGTESDPYKIYNPDQLSQVRNFLSTSGVYFKLMQNIDLTDWIAENYPSQGWQPIGSSSAPFKGVFDGNGKSLTNFLINRSSTNYVGLFGYTDGAAVNNLNLSGTIKGKQYTGSLIGYASNTTISGYTFNGTVTGSGTYCGGVAGLIDMGGGSSSSLNVNATISGSSFLGGLFGQASGIITTANFSGKVTGSSFNTGGAIGLSQGVTITSCFVNAPVSGKNATGGMIGRVNSATNVSNSKHTMAVNGTDSVGGIIGIVNNCQVMLTSCFSDGDIIASGNTCAGGICGYIKSTSSQMSSFSNCSSWGKVKGNSKIGGVAGVCVYVNISDCCSVGEITSTDNSDYLGGIIGYDSNSKIYDSYFSGSIIGGKYVGGLVGYKSNGIIRRNYSNAMINGYDYVGGLAGYLFNTSSSSSSTTLESNVAINSSVFATGSKAGLIYGHNMGYNTTPFNVTSNKSLATTVFYKNGMAQTVTDNLQNGTAVGISQLRYKANYVAMGWDFETKWKILDTESFPYKSWQTAPPSYDGQFDSQTTTISGKSVEGGSVTIITTDAKKSYNTSANNNIWSVKLSTGLHANETVWAYTQKEGLEKSYISATTAKIKGAGTPEDPYLIYDAYDLAAMTKEGNYKLMNDISLTSWINQKSPTLGWTGVGVATVNDSLVFDGRNHKIKGMWSKSTSNYAGLFSYISGTNSLVRNITLENVNVVSNATYAGGLIGNFSGKIVNCEVTGSVSGSGTYAGLLAGYTSGNVTDCSVKGIVNGTATYMGGLIGWTSAEVVSCRTSETTVTSTSSATDSYVGGLCGYSSNITKCMSKCDVSGSKYSGGLCGFLNGVLSMSLSSGSVSGDTYVGGLTGYAVSLVSNCYSSAEVTATSTTGSAYAAGLVGYSLSTINNCYATGNVASTDVVAGVVGYLDSSSAIVNKCVAINDSVSANSVSGFALRVIGGYTNGAADPEQTCLAYKDMAVSINNVPQTVYDDPLNGTATTMDALKTQSTYTCLGWDFSSIWCMNNETGFPDLLWLYKTQSLALDSIPVMYLGYGEQSYILPATTDQGQTITWSSGNSDIAVVSGNILYVKGLGTTTVIAYQPGDDSYLTFNKEFSLTIYNSPFTGSGTVDDPYLIYDAAGLAAIAKDGNYKVMNDIDLTSWINENSPTFGWPGAYAPEIYDSLVIDGDNHKITGLWSHSSSDYKGLYYSGLFTYIAGTNSVIRNLTVENVNINSCAKYIGGLVGDFNGKIENCVVFGTISPFERPNTIGSVAYAGLLAGRTSGNITNCSVSGIVNGTAAYMGGLIGLSKAEIFRCSAEIEIIVYNEGNRATRVAGGLCGRSEGTISQSCSSGLLSIESLGVRAGGLCGRAKESVTNCYSTVEVIATASIDTYSYTAGLVGESMNSVSYCYAAGNISSPNSVAGVVYSLNGSSAMADHCVAINKGIAANSESGIAKRVIGDFNNGAVEPEQTCLAYENMNVTVNNVLQIVNDSPLNGTSTTLSAIQTESTYADLGWDFSKVWYLNPETGFPDLQWKRPNDPHYYSAFFTVEPVQISHNSEQNVSISLENETPIIMAEFYLQLPEGVEIATDEDGYYLADINSSRSNRHQLEVSQSADGIYHFLCYSSRNNAFNNSSGELISMTIICADGIEAGNYKGWIKNIILSDVNKNEINPDDFSFNIEVKDYTMGDVNDDTRINGLDIVEMVDKIMGRPSDSFIFAAGDFDGNGVINGMDLVEEVALVMSQTISGAKARRAPEKISPDIASMSMSKNTDGAISVGIESADGYILSQFVLELSGGQQLTDITASDRNHIVAYQPIDGNRYMVICYSLRNATFADNSDILRVSCEGSGTVSLTDAMLVNADRKLLQAGAAVLSEATGIELVNGSFAKPSDIYSISGSLVKKNAMSAKGLGKGIYVVEGKTLIVK